MNGLIVTQNGQFYSVYIPQGIKIAELFLGADGQYAKDVISLGRITKELANRWDVPTPKKSN